MPVVEGRCTAHRDRVAIAAVLGLVLLLLGTALCCRITIRVGTRLWRAGRVPSEVVARADGGPWAYPQGFHQSTMPPLAAMVSFRVGNLVYDLGWRDVAQLRRLRQRWWQRRLVAGPPNPPRRQAGSP